MLEAHDRASSSSRALPCDRRSESSRQTDSYPPSVGAERSSRRGLRAIARADARTSLQALADVYRNDTPNLTLIEEAAATPQLFERDGEPAPQYRFMRRVHL